MGYIKQGTNLGIKMRAPKDTRVVAFVDSDYASDRNDRKSISGHLVTIGGCLVSWQSKKQTGVTLSSTEAEFVAMSMAATEIKFIVYLLTEMGNGPPVMMPSILQEDNTGAIFMAKNTAISQRTKHVDIRYRFVNHMILSKELWVQHIRCEENPSDTMTKNLPVSLFGKHAAQITEGLLGNLYNPQNTEDVESYCATVTLSSATVPSGQYAKYNGANSQAICSVDANLANQYEDGRTTIIGKHKRKGQEKEKTRKEYESFHGRNESAAWD